MGRLRLWTEWWHIFPEFFPPPMIAVLICQSYSQIFELTHTIINCCCATVLHCVHEERVASILIISSY